jgi:hypothetical protein
MLIPTFVSSIVAPLAWAVRNPANDPTGERTLFRAGAIGFVVGCILLLIGWLIGRRARPATDEDVICDFEPLDQN